MNLCVKFLIIVLLSFVAQTATKALEDCSEIKQANLDFGIENSKLKVETSKLELKISQLELENSLLKSANFKLSKQIEENSAQNENCTVFADTINVVSESLKNIQEELTPLTAHFHVNKTNNNPFEEFVRNSLAENQKVMTKGFNDMTNKILEGRTNSVESQNCLAELKTAKEDLTTATIQAKNISTSLNTCLSELKTVKPKFPKTCKEAANGRFGVFTIEIANSNLPPFPVYCDNDNWMVILRRVDGKVDFQRGWSDYNEGFGDLTGNFIMGLEKMHQITKSQCHEMKVIVKDFKNQESYALYDKFGIDNESNGYALNILGKYSGNTDDELNDHKGMKFTTMDNDNDKWSGNCAKDRIGGWWYNGIGDCTDSKLTGQYLLDGVRDCKGIEWHDGCYSFKYAKMMIRPTTC